MLHRVAVGCIISCVPIIVLSVLFLFFIVLHFSLNHLMRQLFVDTVGPPDSLRAMLQASFPSINITVCPRADSLYPVVSGASILAKVTRDRQIHNWRFFSRSVKTAQWPFPVTLAPDIPPTQTSSDGCLPSGIPCSDCHSLHVSPGAPSRRSCVNEAFRSYGSAKMIMMRRQVKSRPVVNAQGIRRKNIGDKQKGQMATKTNTMPTDPRDARSCFHALGLHSVSLFRPHESLRPWRSAPSQCTWVL